MDPSLLLLWIIAGVVVGIIAHSKGRSGVGWALLSLLLISPLLGGILVLALPSIRPQPPAAPATTLAAPPPLPPLPAESPAAQRLVPAATRGDGSRRMRARNI